MKRILTLSVVVATSLCASEPVFQEEPSNMTPGGRAAYQHNQKLEQSKPLQISQNDYGGRELILSNGQKWEVYSQDLDKSGGWINGEITITKESQSKREGTRVFQYRLHNSATNDSVWARPLDQDQ